MHPYIVNKGDIVQITVNNLDAAIHPFHLHGHRFQVLERAPSNAGTYGGSMSGFPANPSTRDTIQVNGGSYAVIRFQANNPGIWLFHCHIEWHVIMGLIATIREAPQQLIGLGLPNDHKAVCAARGIPTKGNAAGNSVNFTDLMGANTVPPYPDNECEFSMSAVLDFTNVIRAICSNSSSRSGPQRHVKVGRRGIGSTDDV